MLTQGTLPKLREFSTKFSNPDGLYWGMKTYLKARIRLQKKIISRNFLSKLHKKKVGTGEIEACAKRNVFGSDVTENSVRNKLVEKEVSRILRLRIRTSDHKIKELEHEWLCEKRCKDAMFQEESVRWCSRGMECPTMWMESEFCRIENEEMRLQWEDGKAWSIKRAEWLESKYGVQKKNDRLFKENGVKITDEEIIEFDEVENVKEEIGYVVYGENIQLTNEEIEYLNLTPKFREYEKLDIVKWHAEVEINSIKTRWELMGRDKNENKTAEEIKKQIDEAKEASKLYNRETGSVTMSNVRVTDLPTVTRLFPPRPAGGGNEIKIQEPASLAKEAFTQYRGKFCDKDGNLKESNLSKVQLAGKKRLMKRVKDKEIIVATTDKSGKYVLTTPEIYKYAAYKHTEKDIEVGWEDVKSTETFLTRHTIQLADSLRMGVSHDQVDRIHSALKSEDNPPPPMLIMFKDHKETKPGEPCPQSRSVCSAKEGPLARLSHLVSKVLTPLAEELSEKIGTECSNTEEMIRSIHDANLKIKAKLESSQGSEFSSRGLEWVDEIEDFIQTF